MLVVSVTIEFSTGSKSVCSVGSSRFSVTFDELLGLAGDIPQLIVET